MENFLIYFFILIIVFILCYYILNRILKQRAISHSNKFIPKILKKTKLNFFFRENQQNWRVGVFQSKKEFLELDAHYIEQLNWIKFKNSNKELSIADPFLIKEKNLFYLFFEYENEKHLNKNADLAYATSNNGLDWSFQKKIIEEPFHQSFPNIFKEDGDYYMIPETYQANEVRLYKATEFPNKWNLNTILFQGKQFVDTVFLKKESLFYWITTDLETSNLLLFYSNGLKEKWIIHPSSPITSNNKNNRNAGAIIAENGKYYRVAQDGRAGYGSGINIYEILTINKNSYIEESVKEPLFYKSKGITKDAIHHISILNLEDKKLIAVDGANFAINGIKSKLKL
ncbi:hypothetical protein H9I45_03465 [Polaribacter haliotis]|uniref:Glucosamine inositolphosphorylceramide transferase 1 N-terminal domain-containing protein n=1 Tax=Polaribacter haliotis TaxID=1888915 RepID=A0A7L8AHP7_9FLAO|nr:hypothetical protein [Polaribacter haliotis]QOD61522.1 hypothetical protein H9I45_03465 [Polaribacter haliotis]